ncbi:cysteine-rich CWC family protein [Fusobacteria bacterium ZRK30]|nr:cysteine-rich CWC family protein [Fusobacteria bacterium ZRK30]
MDRKICPICGNENNCAHENGKDPHTCWCMNVKIPKEVLEKLKKAKKNNTGGCFCRSCVEKFMKGE